MKEFKKEYLKRLKEKARELRNLTLDMCVRSETGHVPSSFSLQNKISIGKKLYYKQD